MAHDHSHPHSHRHTHDDRVLLWPLILVLGFAFIEAFGGWYTGSLALLGDAGHMFSDAAALGLAWLGAWIAAKPASQRHSYGLLRAEVIVALANGLLMLLVVGGIVYEALARLQHPEPVHGLEVMVIAALGLVVNVIVALQLHRHQGSLNHRAALLHVLGDLLGSVAALAAGGIIYFTGWTPIDPILSLFISGLILVSTVRLLREVLHVLMEGVPHHIEIDQVTARLASIPKVHEIHSVHVWALSSEVTALSAHVVLEDINAWHEVLTACRTVLQAEFDIDHVTLQPETVSALSNGEVACWLTQPHTHSS
ncbi:MAG TPA: cation diffusion facilitator family transporter [Methylophilaceae bacterium]|nr:cation diffusion facilitator family transporter [Methylophilaceae bacterium]